MPDEMDSDPPACPTSPAPEDTAIVPKVECVGFGFRLRLSSSGLKCKGLVLRNSWRWAVGVLCQLARLGLEIRVCRTYC